MLLNDKDRAALAIARARNVARNQYEQYGHARPKGRLGPSPDAFAANHWLALTIGEVAALLSAGCVTIHRYCANIKQARMHTCPWGEAGDLRAVREAVINHPVHGMIYSDHPDWKTFRRSRAPVFTTERLTVRITKAQRYGASWRISMKQGRGTTTQGKE